MYSARPGTKEHMVGGRYVAECGKSGLLATVSYLLLLLFGLLGAVGTYHAVPLLVNRSMRRPLDVPLTEEIATIEACLARPQRLAYLGDLRPEHFCVGTHQRMWARLQETADSITGGLGENPTDERMACAADMILSQLDTFTSTYRNPEPEYTQTLTLTNWADDTSDAEVVKAASTVYGAGIDRDRMSGALPIVSSAHPDSVDILIPPIERTPVVNETRRRWFAGAAFAAFAVVPAMTDTLTFAGMFSTPGLLIMGALISLLLTSIVISWVDLDTLYLDIPSWAVGTVVSYLFAIGFALSVGAPGRILIGGLSALAVIALFEFANWIHKKWRGHDGQGFGDNLIVIGTVGVPVILTGDAVVAYWAIMASLLAAVAIFVVKAAMGKASRATPFAFGPLLATGWIIGLSGYLLLIG